MKKIASVTGGLILITIIITILCQMNATNLNLYAQNLPGIAKIDTVNNIFSITFAPVAPICISSVTANLIFDENSFEYLPDSMRVYGTFQTEAVRFWTPNRIAFGFASNVNVCGFDGTKKIFTIAFKVKDINEPMLKFFELKDIEIYRDGNKIVPYRKDTVRLLVMIVKLFWFNWIIKNY